MIECALKRLAGAWNSSCILGTYQSPTSLHHCHKSQQQRKNKKKQYKHILRITETTKYQKDSQRSNRMNHLMQNSQVMLARFARQSGIL